MFFKLSENVNKHIENTLYVVNTSMRIQIDMKGFFGVYRNMLFIYTSGKINVHLVSSYVN
jgi:hypothetical protein